MKAEMSIEPGSWPMGSNGKPMAKITMGASEKIGLPKYSNVDIGPASVTRFVEDDPDAIRDGLRESVKLCEEIIAEERGAVLELVSSALTKAYGE